MEGEIRALTVRPPWSWAIAHGGKTAENRSWPTQYRGLLAIHGGARSRWDRDGEFSMVLRQAWNAWARTRPDAAYLMGGPTRHSHLVPFGAVVAVAELADCHDATYAEACSCSPWAAARSWHWELANVRPLPEPVPCRGMLGLWRLPDEVEKAVRAQLSEEP